MQIWPGLLFLAIAVEAAVLAQSESGKMIRVALVKMPYVGERNTAELSAGPDYLEQPLPDFNDAKYACKRSSVINWAAASLVIAASTSLANSRRLARS
jgi:hypothetical protein